MTIQGTLFVQFRSTSIISKCHYGFGSESDRSGYTSASVSHFMNFYADTPLLCRDRVLQKNASRTQTNSHILNPSGRLFCIIVYVEYTFFPSWVPDCCIKQKQALRIVALFLMTIAHFVKFLSSNIGPYLPNNRCLFTKMFHYTMFKNGYQPI